MAADRNLYQRSSQGPVMRLYDWDHTAVTLGQFQDPAIAVGPDCEDSAVRPTGGLAVLHGHDLTVAIADSNHMSDFVSPKFFYKKLAGVLLRAFCDLGIKAEFGGQSAPSGVTGLQDCFLRAAKYDIVDLASGTKICGCALNCSRNNSLLQCSIPIREPLVDPARWILGGSRMPHLKISQDALIERLELSFLANLQS